MIVPSIRALAPHVGMSHTALDKHLKRGKFQAEPGGGYDVDKVKAALKRTQDLEQPSQAKGARSPVLAQPVAGDSAPAGRRVEVEAEPQPHGGWLKREHAIEPDSSGSDFAIFNHAKALKEKVRAEEAQLDLRKRNGELLERAEIMRLLGDLIVTAKTNLRGVGAKVAPDLAAETDAGKCKQMVDEQVDEALDAVCRWMPPGMIDELGRTDIPDAR